MRESLKLNIEIIVHAETACYTLRMGKGKKARVLSLRVREAEDIAKYFKIKIQVR